MAKYLSNRVRTFDIGITSITESDDVLNVIGNSTFTGDATFQGNVNLGDNDRLRLGDGADLQIYHDASNSWIRDLGTGRLLLTTDGISIDFKTNSSSEFMARFLQDDAVELYYDNSKKFETTATGATTTGIHVADGFDAGDNERLRLGDGNDLQIFHDGTDDIISSSGSTLKITGSRIVINNAANNENQAVFEENGAVELYYDAVKKIETTSTGVTVTGTVVADGVTLGDDEKLEFGAGQDLQIFHNGSLSKIRDQGTGSLFIEGNQVFISNVLNGNTMARFVPGGAVELHHDGTEKFETTSTGVTVTGTVVADGVHLGDDDELRFGAGDDFKIYHDPDDARLENSNGDIKFKNTGSYFFFDEDGGETLASFINDGAVNLFHNGNKKFETTATGADVTGSLRASTSLVTTTDGTGITITNNTIQGPSTLTIDPAAIGDNTGTVVIAGDLQIDGTTTTVNSTTMTVDDKNLELGTGAANDAAADGGGITIVSGDGNKTFQFEATGDNLGSSENLNLANTKEYKINNTSVLSATTLGSGVTASSLTSVGTLTSLSVSGDLSIADKIVHIGDTDTAIRFPVDDTFTVETAGSERLRIKSDGNVGIGNDNPQRKFVVEGSGNTFASVRAGTSDDVGLIFGDTDNDARGLIRYANDGDSLRFWTAGSERLRITSSGFVGINETNPRTGLTINEWGTEPVSNSNTYPYPAGNWVTNWVTQTNNSNDYWAGFGGGGYLRSSSTVNIALAPNHADVSDQAGMYIAGEATSTTTSVFTIGKIVGGSATGSSSSAGTQRATKDELFRITHTGNVGVNTTAPREKFDISAGRIILDEDYQFTWADGTTNRARIYGDSGNNFIIENGSSNTERLRIGSAGQIGLGGANYGNSGQVLTSNGSSSAPTWQDFAVSATDESTDTTCFPLFATDATGTINIKTDASGLTYNAADEILSATTFSGSTLISTVATGTAPLTVTSTTLVSNLNADLLDGQQGSFYLNTGTTFGGDVSGTYNAIVIANDSHTHQFDNLTFKAAGTGNYSTTGYLESGRGSGGIALTINDGYGNANVTFNHRSGTPEQDGKAGRIEVNTDLTTTGAATMSFELGDATSGVAGNIAQILQLSSVNSSFTSNAGLTFNNRPSFNGGTSGSSSPFTVNSTQVVTDLNADLLDGQQGTFYTDASNIDAGTLAIARGGTNGSATPTAGGAAYGTGTAYAFTAVGTSGQVLTSNGASAPTWQDVAVSATDESTDTTCFPLFATDATGAVAIKTDASGLTYDSANERLQSTDVAVKGAVRVENSGSTERFEILYNETTDSLDFTYSAS